MNLFDDIRNISTLQQIVIGSYHHPIPAQVLSLMLQRKCCRLESPRIRHVHFAGEQKDFQDFSDAARTSSTLSKAVVSSCKTSLDTLSPLVEGLISLRNLQELHLEEMKVSGESLALICGSSSIDKLSLRHVPACNLKMEGMAQALRSKQVLRDLQLRSSLDQKAAIAFFDMLEDNISLRRIGVDVAYWEEYSEPLSRVFLRNSPLESLELNIFGEDSQVEANAAAIASSLEDNAKMKRLCVTFQNRLVPENGNQESILETMNAAFVGSFSKIPPKNCVLEELSIGFAHQKVGFSDDIKFFLKLNRAGRRNFMASQCSRRDWIEMLIRYRDDVDVIFYFLTMNPSITDTTISTVEPKDTTTTTIDEPQLKRSKLESATRTMG